jgi:hypothetical protein
MIDQDQIVAKKTDIDVDSPSSKLNRSEREERSPCWDMSQERVFIETICNQRFNFFLAFFGASLIGASNAHEPTTRFLLLLFSLCICTLLASKIGWTYKRLEAVVLYIRTDPTHPETIITKKLNEHSTKSRFAKLLAKHDGFFGMFSVYSFWIPIVCLLILATLLLTSIATGIKQPIPSNGHQESTSAINR